MSVYHLDDHPTTVVARGFDPVFHTTGTDTKHKFQNYRIFSQEQSLTTMSQNYTVWFPPSLFHLRKQEKKIQQKYSHPPPQRTQHQLKVKYIYITSPPQASTQHVYWVAQEWHKSLKLFLWIGIKRIYLRKVSSLDSMFSTRIKNVNKKWCIFPRKFFIVSYIIEVFSMEKLNQPHRCCAR